MFNTRLRFVSLVVASVSAMVAPAIVRAQGHHASAAPSAAPSAPVVLRMTYTPNQRVTYTTRSVQTAPAPMGQTTTTGTVQITTTAVHPDGSAQLQLRISNMDVQGAVISPDARQQLQHGLSGLSMSYTQNARGQIVSRDEPTGVSPQFRALVDGVLQSLDQMSPQLPEQAVAIGATWQDHRTTHVSIGPGAQMDLTIDVTYTLRELRQGPHGPVAVIGLAMTMGIGHGPSGSVPITGTGNATGEMTIELGRGVLSDSHSNGSMNMHVSAQGRTADIATTFTNEMRATGVTR
jgi:hypothetical protein